MQLPSLMTVNLNAAKKQREDEKSRKQFERELIDEMEVVVSRLGEISDTFDLVSEAELIDAIIYEELALKSHYAYLLRLAKENNITAKFSKYRKDESDVLN